MRNRGMAGSAPPRTAAPAARPNPSSAAPCESPSTNSGLARHPGRPAVPIDMNQLQQLRGQNLSVRQIGRMMGVSKSGIAAALRRLANTPANVSNNS